MNNPTINPIPDPPRGSGTLLRSQIVSLIEIPGLLLAAYIFVSGAGSQYAYSEPDAFSSNTPLYLGLFLYLAALACIAALIVIVVAFFQTGNQEKVRFLIRGNVLAAIFFGVGTAGDIFLHSIWDWTQSAAIEGRLSPTANGVITQLILSVAAGTAVAIVPAIVVFLLRRQPMEPV